MCQIPLFCSYELNRNQKSLFLKSSFKICPHKTVSLSQCLMTHQSLQSILCIYSTGIDVSSEDALPDQNVPLALLGTTGFKTQIQSLYITLYVIKSQIHEWEFPSSTLFGLQWIYCMFLLVLIQHERAFEQTNISCQHPLRNSVDVLIISS